MKGSCSNAGKRYPTYKSQNRYPVDKFWNNNHAIHWMVIYPVPIPIEFSRSPLPGACNFHTESVRVIFKLAFPANQFWVTNPGSPVMASFVPPEGTGGTRTRHERVAEIEPMTEGEVIFASELQTHLNLLKRWNAFPSINCHERH